MEIREKREEERRRKKENLSRLDKEVATIISRGILQAAKEKNPRILVPDMGIPEAFRSLPVADLAAGIGECLGAIKLVGQRSSTLKETFGAPNKAIVNIQLSTTAFVTRMKVAEGEPSAFAEEFDGLSGVLASLRAESNILREDIERLRHPPSLLAVSPSGRTYAAMAKSTVADRRGDVSPSFAASTQEAEEIFCGRVSPGPQNPVLLFFGGLDDSGASFAGVPSGAPAS